MERNQMANMRTLLMLLLAPPIMFPVSMLGQQKNVLPVCSFANVNYQVGRGALEIQVGFAVNAPSSSKTPVDWELIDATAGSIVHIKTPPPLDQGDLWWSARLATEHRYILTVCALPSSKPDHP